MARKKRWTVAELSQLDWDAIGKMTTEQIAEILKQAKRQFDRKEKAIFHSGEISGALLAYYNVDAEKYLETTMGRGKFDRTKKVESLIRTHTGKDRNTMISELASLEGFFRAETSNVPGVRKVNRAQDIRIFGVNEKGQPKYQMSNEERIKYWSLYDEFMHQYRDRSTAYTSGTVQQLLGEIQVQDPYEVDYSVLLQRLFVRAEAMLGNKVKFDEEGGYEIFSIKWTKVARRISSRTTIAS